MCAYVAILSASRVWKSKEQIYIRPITRVTIEQDIRAGEHGQRIKRALSHDPCNDRTTLIISITAQPFPPWIISPGVLMTLVDGSMENNAMAGIQCGLHINTWTELELVFRVLLIN